MNMRKNFIYCLLIFIVLLCGCGKSSQRGNGFAIVTPTDSVPEPTRIPVLKPTEEPDPTKTPAQTFTGIVLHWLIPDIGAVTEKQTEAFNALLDERGCGYHVSFSTARFEAHEEDLSKALPCTDIASTGFMSSNYGGHLFKEGIFEALDSYLEGSELYNRFSEKIWERVRVNHTIYSIPNTGGYPTVIYYVFNREFFNEEQVADASLTLAGIEELLSAVPQKDGFSPLIMGSTLNQLGFNGVNIRDGLVFSETYGINSIWESPDVEEMFLLLRRYKDKGYLNYNFTDGILNQDYPNLYEAYRTLKGPTWQKLTERMQYGVLITTDVLSLPDEDKAIIVKTPGLITSNIGAGMGIIATSLHKEEAFDLLCRFYTDTELQKILIAPDDTITAENSLDLYDARLLRAMAFGTRDLFFPDIQERNALFDKCEVSAYCGFFPDFGAAQDRHIAASSLIYYYQYIWAFPNYEELKEELADQLRELRVTDSIASVREQYAEWKKD